MKLCVTLLAYTLPATLGNTPWVPLYRYHRLHTAKQASSKYLNRADVPVNFKSSSWNLMKPEAAEKTELPKKNVAKKPDWTLRTPYIAQPKKDVAKKSEWTLRTPYIAQPKKDVAKQPGWTLRTPYIAQQRCRDINPTKTPQGSISNAGNDLQKPSCWRLTDNQSNFKFLLEITELDGLQYDNRCTSGGLKINGRQYCSKPNGPITIDATRELMIEWPGALQSVRSTVPQPKFFLKYQAFDSNYADQAEKCLNRGNYGWVKYYWNPQCNKCTTYSPSHISHCVVCGCNTKNKDQKWGYQQAHVSGSFNG